MIDEYNKAYHCNHFDIEKEYCRKIKHELQNGYAIAYHCKNCGNFKEANKCELKNPKGILSLFKKFS